MIERLMSESDIYLAADGMLHTRPMEGKCAITELRRLSSPYGDSAFTDYLGLNGRKRGVYYRRSLHNGDDHAEALVCLTCDLPKCAGEWRCFLTRCCQLYLRG